MKITMKARGDMAAAFAASVLLHALVLFGAAGVLRPRDAIAPALQTGESALTLTLLSIPVPPALQPKEARSAPVQPETKILPPAEPNVVVVPPQLPPPEPEPMAIRDELFEPVEEQPENPDADLLVKGVQGEVLPASEIRPRYPLGARMRGEEGVVTLNVAVAASGEAKTVEVRQSSGYPALDNAAVRAVSRAKFVGAGDNGLSMTANVTLSFRFRLLD